MEPIDRLELAIESAEKLDRPSLTLTSTLCEVFRIARRGFTDSEATYWSERIENLTGESVVQS